jgi:hypothetical protein
MAFLAIRSTGLTRSLGTLRRKKKAFYPNLASKVPSMLTAVHLLF